MIKLQENKNQREKKIKDENILTNLYEIRKELGLSQEKFASILGVAKDSYRSYELREIVLPIDLGIYIMNKYGYTLEYIYGLDNKIYTRKSKEFLVDIRDIVQNWNKKKLELFISIPHSYLNYLKQTQKIHDSIRTDNEKEHEIIRLDAEYKRDNSSYYNIRVSKFETPCILDGQVYISANEYTPHLEMKTDEEREKILESVIMLKEEENE